MDILIALMKKYDLVAAIVITGGIMVLSKGFAKKIKQERMASAMAIVIGLIAAYIAGTYTGDKKGVADIAMFSGFGLLGGSMLRDYTIISTAYGVKTEDLKKSGTAGAISLLIGVGFSFVVGVGIAWILGFRDPAELATIGGGTCTFIVGPITGSALGVGSNVIALSIAAGVVKSVLTMILTPFVADKIGLNNPKSAMVFGGLIGSTSGVAGALAATDPKLVSYGAMVATFYTGAGSLLVPTVGYSLVKLLF
ncbi:malonate transporter subunit MadM [uncultured Ilyobacter sp.]|jgi:malonate transporter MadM subunit|uniref:malonate transporter subunit MadM n=1 Tax=uncultured Ilyobacter sp. TaxID=544433 RepID=UPI0029C0C093|nr:malonate transporter subunit MadM [uncultured Ilyobacter sp.]